LAAHFFIEYLAVWEKDAAAILKKIKKEFLDEIKDLRE
jgi:hypothetical protein